MKDAKSQLHRRSFLFAAPALGAAIAPQTAQSAEPAHKVELATLIDRHRQLDTEVNNLIKYADEMHPQFDPSKVSTVRQKEASLWKLTLELSQYPIADMSQVRLKAAYFAEMHTRGALGDVELEHFLYSVR